MNNDTKKRTETRACDCISRAAAIDSLDAEIEITGRTNAEVVKGYVRLVKDRLERLPSAQPTQNERVNSNNPLDCISRQAAITNIQKAYADTEGGTDKCAVWKNVGLTNALHIMQDLPSAQSASYRQVTGKLDSASRQAEIDAWKADFKGYVDSLDLLRDDYNGIMEYIDETPSAQPDIIRCKDCKHYVLHTLFGRSQGWCERLCDEFDKSLARGTDDDDFCSRAERREG